MKSPGVLMSSETFHAAVSGSALDARVIRQVCGNVKANICLFLFDRPKTSKTASVLK